MTMRNGSVARDDRALQRQHLRILIAEDHPGTQRAMQLVLRWLGCAADIADDGRAVLDAVRSREYDIILMDILMPRMDGLEATRRIRRERAPASTPRIVGVSAETLPEDQDLCFAAGMDDFLPKPIEIDDLVRILDEVAVGLSAVC